MCTHAFCSATAAATHCTWIGLLVLQGCQNEGPDCMIKVLTLIVATMQCTWIGYPNTTGLAAVDYRLTDKLCDPLNTSQVRCEA